MTLSAKLGNLEMFSFLLEEEKQLQWKYGPIQAWIYPLEQIDMPLALPPPGDRAHGPRRPDIEEDPDVAHPRALELILNEAHLDLLMHPRMIELIKQKWERFASRIFFQRFLVVLVYLCLFTVRLSLMASCAHACWPGWPSAAIATDRCESHLLTLGSLCCFLRLCPQVTTIHRQTENILGIQQWSQFEEHLLIYKNQTGHIEHLTRERAELMQEMEIHAEGVLAERQKQHQAHLLQLAMRRKSKSSADGGMSTATVVPDPPTLEGVRAELLRNLSLPAIPTLHVLDGLDLPGLERLVAMENDKAASRESVALARLKRLELDMEDGVLGNAPGWPQVDISHMSSAELAAMLTPPEMLYDDGILGGFTDMMYEVLSHPPIDWPAIIWRYPCLLFLGEMVVVGGAFYKGSNEVSEMRDRGINNYFGAAGSAFFENSLSLTFSTLMITSFLLSLSGSSLVRMFIGMCSIVGWSYMFFFLLAFRMTGPMIVMVRSGKRGESAHSGQWTWG